VALYLDDIPLDINASSAWCLANVAHTPVFEVGILARQQDRTVSLKYKYCFIRFHVSVNKNHLSF
jgi:hypothetical protein